MLHFKKNIYTSLLLKMFRQKKKYGKLLFYVLELSQDSKIINQTGTYRIYFIVQSSREFRQVKEAFYPFFFFFVYTSKYYSLIDNFWILRAVPTHRKSTFHIFFFFFSTFSFWGKILRRVGGIKLITDPQMHMVKNFYTKTWLKIFLH